MSRSRSRPPAVLPLGIKDRQRTELPALVALNAIGQPWFCSQHQTDLLAVALVVRELAPPGSLEADCALQLQGLCEKAIVAEDKVAIALSLAECLPWLQMQSNSRVQKAILSVMRKQCPVACAA